MQFQIIKDEYYNKIIVQLKALVPEFDSIFDIDNVVYPILAEFTTFLIANIENRIILNKCFQFLNEALQEGNNDTEDAIVLQVFQPIYQDQFLVQKIRSGLSGKAIIIFDKFK